MTAFSLGTFGFPEVHTDGRPIKLALRKGLALLVYLAEAKGAVARDVLATLLWPEADRETGLVVHHSDFDVLIPSHSRIGKLSGGTRISMLLGSRVDVG
jgi:two-component SAPR family response regulator